MKTKELVKATPKETPVKLVETQMCIPLWWFQGKKKESQTLSF